MIFKILEILRQKPSHIRSLYALGASFAFTLVVAMLWFVSYSAYVDRVFLERDMALMASSSEGAVTGPGYFSRLKASVSEGVAQIKAQVSDLVTFGNPGTGTSSDPIFSMQASSSIQTEPDYQATSTGSSSQNLIEYGTSTRGTSTSDSI
ncbi:MAG TPA: hypothetical protein VGE62_02375 [Candidatus Paceibacterota bacterium]